MTVRLRAHHLLCVLTYVGRGYGPAFTANYDGVVGRLGRGEEILLVAGPDDICAPLLGDDGPHCLGARVVERDARAAEAAAALLCTPIRPGLRIVLDTEMLRKMRAAFRSGATRQACTDCEWAPLCSAVADRGFAGARLT